MMLAVSMSTWLKSMAGIFGRVRKYAMPPSARSVSIAIPTAKRRCQRVI